MGTYQQVFGGQTIYPAQLTFKNIDLTADLTLEWPAEIATTNDVVAWIMRVSPASGGLSIIMDDATLASNGVSLLFYNAGAFTFTLKNSAGGTIASIDAGTGWDIILIDNSTAAGTWLVIQRGAGTSGAQASLLAGAGLTALGGLLASSILITSKSADFSVAATDRATMLDWTGGSGAATINAAPLLGSGWWAIIRNDGSGALTVSPAAGQIDGSSSKVFDPDAAAFIFQDGTNFFTVGLGGGGGGTSFDYVSIDISGASGGNYTLSGAQLNRISYQFTGVLTGDVQVVIPSTVQQYWVTNATTGAFAVAIRTAAQTPPGVDVAQGITIIGYCNGTIFIQAAGTISTPVGIAQGGTGATTATGALANLGAAGVAVDNNFSANQTVVSTDSGAGVAPLVTAYRNSGSPAASDVMGGFNFDGNNSTPAQKTYASVQATILGKTAASEAATLDFLTTVAGALAKRGGFGQGFVIGGAADGGLGTIGLSSTNASMVSATQTDAGALPGPSVLLTRNSVSPAALDFIGSLQWYGKDSGGNTTLYADLTGQITDPTDGSEDAIFCFSAMIGGSYKLMASIGTTAQNVYSYDASATAGPLVNLFRDSASPAASDAIGYISFGGRDSAANVQEYGRITGHILDATSTSEDGSISIDTVVAGAAPAVAVTVAQGLFMPGTTDPGPGKINAIDVQINGVSVATSGKLVSTGHSELVALTTCTTAIPHNDTAPTITQGDQILSLAATTTTSTQIVKISVVVNTSSSGIFPAMAVWRDGTTLVGTAYTTSNSTAPNQFMTLNLQDSPAAAGTYTYTVRCGPSSGSLFINGTSGATRIGGGTQRGATIDTQVIEP